MPAVNARSKKKSKLLYYHVLLPAIWIESVNNMDGASVSITIKK